MSAKHQTAEYRRNARTVRDRVASVHRRGEAVPCWRCRRAIPPGMRYDVGHVNGPSNALGNLAPEHRHEIPGICPGNRSKGGKVGAAMTNARHTPTIPAERARVWPV